MEDWLQKLTVNIKESTEELTIIEKGIIYLLTFVSLCKSVYVSVLYSYAFTELIEELGGNGKRRMRHQHSDLDYSLAQNLKVCQVWMKFSECFSIYADVPKFEPSFFFAEYGGMSCCHWSEPGIYKPKAIPQVPRSPKDFSSIPLTLHRSPWNVPRESPTTAFIYH